MKLTLITSLILFSIACNSSQEKKSQLPLLKISENKRFLTNEDDNPFFWLGDTGWLLFKKLSREEAEFYLENRSKLGFNVVQAMIIHDINTPVNAYGDSAFVNKNFTRPLVTQGNVFEDQDAYDYWDHVDYIIKLAEKKGIYMALVPLWGSNVSGGNLSVDQAQTYGTWLANRYKNFNNIIWLNGGDKRGDQNKEVWNMLGKSISEVDSSHLMTYHPFGRTQSSIWFHNEDWLDFNMFQSGHRRYDQDDSENGFGQDNWKYVWSDYRLTPIKPTIDGEPSYEHIPQGLHDTLQPRWNENDARRYAYWSVFKGAFGHTYGHNSVMQFYNTKDENGSYGEKIPWKSALNAKGAIQMKYLKDLILSRPFLDRVPDADLIAKKQGKKYDYLAATRGANYAFIYTYNGRNMFIQMEQMQGEKVMAQWFNPRNGDKMEVGIYDNSGVVQFDPPGDVTDGNDWVLVLDAH